MTRSYHSRRQLLTAGSALAVLGFSACCAAQPTSQGPTPRLRLIGETRLPHRLQHQGTTVGGLSGIDFDPISGVLYLLSDDGGSQSPPRFYTARLALTADKLGDIELTGVTFLQGFNLPDPEAIRWHAPSQSLLWTSEGNALLLAAPSLQQTRLDGTLVRAFDLPAMFGFGLASGARINKTFEGLAIAPDGRSAWLAMEAALRQDGPEPTVAAPGGPCRFTLIDIATAKTGRVALRQIAYVPDAIPKAPVPPSADADNGVVEVLMLDAHRMLVLERAYMAGLSDIERNSMRLYLIDTRLATDTLGIAALKPGNHTPAAKTLVADFASFSALTRLDNTEGVCWGPKLPNGNRTLLVVSDDNFNPRQITQFLAFEFLD